MKTGLVRAAAIESAVRLLRPVVLLGLLIAAARGSNVAFIIGATLLSILVTLRVREGWCGLRLARVRVQRWDREEHEETLPPCRSLCSCGCGGDVRSIPEDDCGKPCACGCGRACLIHAEHRGLCGA